MKFNEKILVASLVVTSFYSYGLDFSKFGTPLNLEGQHKFPADVIPREFRVVGFLKDNDDSLSYFHSIISSDQWIIYVAYSEENELKLYGFDAIDQELLGVWDLRNIDCYGSEDCFATAGSGRWAEEYLEEELSYEQYNQARGIDYRFGPRIDYENINDEYQVWGVASSGEYVPENTGCYSYDTLGFSDIESDGVKDILIFFRHSWAIFSTEKNEIIFSNYYRYSHFMPWQELYESGEFYLKEPKEDTPQYGYFELARIIDIYPAFRLYSKSYFGDFDEDGQFDILQWRKFYWTNTYGEEAGFSLDRNTFLHYEKHNGEYQRQATAQSEVESWLTDNNLFWQDGFPTESRCPGREGELIPESHDPLLNDPDVLVPSSGAPNPIATPAINAEGSNATDHLKEQSNDTSMSTQQSEFVGQVAGANIQMTLQFFEDGSVSGHYLYTSSNIPIALEGSMNNETGITLKTVGNPDITETFVADVAIENGQVLSLQGTWYGTHSIEGENEKGYEFSVR